MIEVWGVPKANIVGNIWVMILLIKTETNPPETPASFKKLLNRCPELFTEPKGLTLKRSQDHFIRVAKLGI